MNRSGVQFPSRAHFSCAQPGTALGDLTAALAMTASEECLQACEQLQGFESRNVPQ